jgi:hypothetical protein
MSETICAVICDCGPNGEPLACAYAPEHDGVHSWASIPTWTKRWRITHFPSTEPKKFSSSIEGPPTDGSQVVYGVVMYRGIPAHEREDETLMPQRQERR